MGKVRVDIDNWKRKKKFEFFVEMLNPIYSITARVNLDNCYRAAKRDGKSLFLCYSYALIKAINEIEEFRYLVTREDGELVVLRFDSVDLVSPVTTGEDGEFAEVRILYKADFEEFYHSAEQIISSASADMDPIIEVDIDATYAVVSAMPFVDMVTISPTLMDRGGVNQVPLISVGKMSEVDGRRSMAVAIAVHHGFADGYHVGKFFEQVQRTLDSF